MKILELELVQYKRLALNNIRYFKLELKEIVQLILGTNASGKSSILYELSPLPANHKSYYKGGKKRILISKDGKTYELISDFADGQHHYFYVDGENLNVGRTVTVQAELVQEHFSLNSKTHEIMLGIEQFTRMLPSRRREVFTMLCVVDYTYAIKLYKKIQENLRDTSGAIKVTKRRLGDETSKSLKDDEIAALRKRLAELNKESQGMYMLRNANALTVSEATTVAEAAAKMIQQIKDKFSGIRRLLRDRSYISPAEYQEEIDTAKVELGSIEAVYNRLAEEFISASSEVDQVSGLEGEDVTKLKDQIIADNEFAKQLLSGRKKPLEGFNAVKATQSLEVVYESLVEVLTKLPADPDGKMTSVVLTDVSEKLRELQSSLGANREKIAGLEHREQHLSELANAETISCPECEHQWKLGYSEDEHGQLKNRLEQGRRLTGLLDTQVNELTERQEQLVSYSNLFREFMRITKNTPELQPLWDLVAEEDTLRRSPAHVLTLVELVRSDLRIEMQAHAVREKIATDMERLKMAEYAQSATIKEKRSRLEQLEQEIGRLSMQKLSTQSRLQDMVIMQRQLNHMYTVGQSMSEAREKFNQSHVTLIDAMKNEIIDEALAETHREIATLATRIHSIDQHETLLADLKKQISELEKTEKAYKALSDALSPVDGLIAEGMLGFIRHYVARMNALIAKIWTYPMIVHDCSTEEESAELNYKFPLTTPNLPEPVPDVSNGSAGQQEMIDLAFRIVAAQCLGLDRGPLFLDEFGKTFDQSHREAATMVMHQLVEQLSFSQLFMISHYEASYGAFYNAQMTVVDKRNITVPTNRKYNEYTTIETA